MHRGPFLGLFLCLSGETLRRPHLSWLIGGQVSIHGSNSGPFEDSPGVFCLSVTELDCI